MVSVGIVVVLFFVTLPFNALGGAFVWWGSRGVRNWWSERNRFEPVEATVTSAEPVELEDRPGVYVPALTVEYTVEGETYEGTPYTDEDRPTGTENATREYIRNLESGPITVHVDPEIPDKPVLEYEEPSPPFVSIAVATLGLGFAGIGVGSLLAGVLAALGVV